MERRALCLVCYQGPAGERCRRRVLFIVLTRSAQVLRAETDPNGEARIVRLHDDWVNTEITPGKLIP